MIRIWKCEIYDNFKCITSKCPSNCCDEDWEISIDNETYDSLSALQISGLNQCISPDEPHVLIKKDHKCPFITQEGLCVIHRDLGEDYLSNTCRSYPRFVSGYGDIFTQTLGVSCPEVARLLLALNHVIEFKSEFYYEEKKEIGKTLDYLESENVFQSTLRFFDGKSDVLASFQSLALKNGYIDNLVAKPFELIIEELRNKSEIVGGLSIFSDLKFDSVRINKEDLVEINKAMYRKYPFLAHNIARNYLFEHIMYVERMDEKNYIPVFMKAELAVLIFYCAINSHKQETIPDFETTRNVLYKTMRLIDHNEMILDSLLAVCI